jgi:hypothetical protein
MLIWKSKIFWNVNYFQIRTMLQFSNSVFDTIFLVQNCERCVGDMIQSNNIKDNIAGILFLFSKIVALIKS